MNKYTLKIDSSIEYHFENFRDTLKMAEQYLSESHRVEVYMKVWENGVCVDGKK